MSDHVSFFPSRPEIHELKQAADAFRRLAEDFDDAKLLDPSGERLRLELNRDLPIQAGKLLSSCLDKRAFLEFPGYGRVQGRVVTEWEIRWFDSEWARRKLRREVDEAARFLKNEPEDHPERQPTIDRLKTIADLLESLDSDTFQEALEQELVYFFVWTAAVRWWLAKEYPERLPNITPEVFHPWIERYSQQARHGGLQPRPKMTLPKASASKQRVFARIQAEACILLAEFLENHARKQIKALEFIEGEGAEDSLAAGLPPSSQRAYQQHNWAIQQNPALNGAIDLDVYNWLREHCDGEEELPSFATWQRYLRNARAHFDDRKYERRSGRPRGRSIARRDEI